ncbi:MAG: sulfatase activating formylglycine-generating enzyme, partial [Verrucomicrobiales bacterium]
MYQMVCGRPPFRAPSTLAVLKRVCDDTPRPIEDVIPGIPVWLCTIIFRLLEKDRETRYQTAQEVADLLARCQSELQTNGIVTCVQGRSEPTGTLVRNVSPDGGANSRLRSMGWIAGGLIAVAAVIGLVMMNGDRALDRDVATVPGEDAADTNTHASANPAESPGWHGWPADAPPPAIAPFDAEQARQHQETWAKYLDIDVEYTNSIGMKFMFIPPGEFTMGSTPEEIEEALKFVDPNNPGRTILQDCIRSEAPQHKVILTKPIYLGVNEVTQAEYEKVMGVNPSHFAPMGEGQDAVAGLDTGSHPVETVSWNDAADFCAKLSSEEELKPFYFRAGETITPLAGTGYRLPTEAEWECACRAGTTTKFWIGDRDEELARAGWFQANSGGRPHAAGELKANPYGVFDIHGNVFEWVDDGWKPTYYEEFQGKPARSQLCRGGGWYFKPSRCRAAARCALVTEEHTRKFIGFRVSLTIAATQTVITNSAVPGDPPVQSVSDTQVIDFVRSTGGRMTLGEPPLAGTSLTAWENPPPLSSNVVHFDFRSAQRGSDGYLLGHYNHETNQDRIYLYISGTDLYARIGSAEGQKVADNVTEGNWHDIAFVYGSAADVDAASVYVDGQLSQKLPVPKAKLQTTSELKIGACTTAIKGGTQLHFVGEIRDVHFYDVTLDSEQIHAARDGSPTSTNLNAAASPSDGSDSPPITVTPVFKVADTHTFDGTNLVDVNRQVPASGTITLAFRSSKLNFGHDFGDEQLTRFAKLIESRPDIKVGVVNLVGTKITNAGLLTLHQVPMEEVMLTNSAVRCDEIADQLSRFAIKDWDFGDTLTSNGLSKFVKNPHLRGISLHSNVIGTSSLSVFADSSLQRLEFRGAYERRRPMPSVSQLSRFLTLTDLYLPYYRRWLTPEKVEELQESLPQVRIHFDTYAGRLPLPPQYPENDLEILSLVESVGGTILQYRPEGLVRLLAADNPSLAAGRINISIWGQPQFDDASLIRLANLLKQRPDLFIVCFHVQGTSITNTGLRSLKGFKIAQLFCGRTNVNGDEIANEASEFKIGDWALVPGLTEAGWGKFLENPYLTAVTITAEQVTPSFMDQLAESHAFRMWITGPKASDLPTPDLFSDAIGLSEVTLHLDEVVPEDYVSELHKHAPWLKIQTKTVTIAPSADAIRSTLAQGRL